MLRSPSPLALVLAICVTATSLPAAHQAHAAAPSQADKDLAEAKKLYKEGQTKFEMADYEEAIALWKQAYTTLPDAENTRGIKNDLVYNISEAQIRAYEIGRDVTYLRKARVLLNDYLRNHERMYGTGKEAVEERSAAKTRLEEVDEMLADAPEGGGPAPSGDGGDADGDDGGGATDEEPAKEMSADEKREAEERAAREARLQEIQTDPTLKAQDEAARKRIVTGAALGGVGITLLAAAYVTVSLGTTVDSTPDPGDVAEPEIGTGALVAAIVLGVGGLGLLGAGGGLFGTGMKQRKQLRTPPQKATALAVPWVGRNSGGATVLVRF